VNETIAVTNAAHALLDRHIAAAEGNEPAFKYVEKRYTFNDLAAIANRTGNMLKQAGVKPGAAVLLAAPPSPAYAGTILGAMKIGAWTAVLEGAVDAARLSSAARAASPVLTIVHQNNVGAISGAALGVGVVVIGAAGPEHKSFVDLIREQASSLAVATVSESATALAVFDNAKMHTISHRDLARDLASPEGASAASTALALLRALAQGREFALA
jgi:acyl-coenzyme A synthetase/AMP-(fatty) acid ligase